MIFTVWKSFPLYEACWCTGEFSLSQNCTGECLLSQNFCLINTHSHMSQTSLSQRILRASCSLSQLSVCHQNTFIFLSLKILLNLQHVIIFFLMTNSKKVRRMQKNRRFWHISGVLSLRNGWIKANKACNHFQDSFPGRS